MRVYELAKKFGVSSKQLMELLAQEGIEASSHMALLNEHDAARIEQLMSKKTKDTVKNIQQHKKAPVLDVGNNQAIAQDALNKKNKRVEKRQDDIKTPKIKPQKTEQPEVAKVNNAVPTNPAISIIIEPMLVSDFAEKIGIPTSDVILALLRWGILSAKNQRIEKELVAKLAAHFGIETIERQKAAHDAVLGNASDYVVKEDALVTRLPVVVVLGHVDHGKTSLLDYIRKTRVADKEKGGITQHIGAYEAVTPQGNVIFIDTPGHEAFSKIRQRGSRVADIAILVIAADDGIMPQTAEAIKHIKSANIPVVVAVNKIDKVDPSRIDVIKRQLAQHDLLPEDWGGQIVVVPISAKTGKGIDTLLEMVILQTQLLELRAEENTLYKGYILESRLEKGRGAVATVLGKHGTLKIGDYFVCGETTGKVTSIVNSSGTSLQTDRTVTACCGGWF